MKRLLWLLALAGCPAETPFVVTDVHVAGRPVADALVGVYCAGTPRRDVLGVTGGSAIRTDEAGRARLHLPGHVPASDCTVTVAKPGLPTIEARGANACSSPVQCPALAIDLGAAGVAPPIEQDRELAPPPVERPPGDFARPPSPRSHAAPIPSPRFDDAVPAAPHAEVAR
jgi:hypothetical protein